MKLLSVFSLIFVLFACVKNNPDPSWVQINTWTLEANSSLNGDEGSLSHNFSHAWIYADGQLIGVFELPIKIPILDEGVSELKIFPVIEDNGISATKKIYPFVKSYDIQVDLVKNETVVINPKTSYKDNLDFWIENFDDSFNFKFDSDPNYPATMIYGNDPQYLQWGSGYGRITLNAQDSAFLGYTENTQDGVFTDWAIGQDIYLEIDYRNTNAVVTGLIETNSAGITNHPMIQLNGQETGKDVWKKIYIDLREVVSGTPNSFNYRLYLLSAFEGGNPRNILIDNVKVVHY
jgi:hypothetical protein